MAGYVRQSVADIVTGLVVEAAPINNEYNAILAAMHASTGHNHDGTTGGGAKIHLVNSIDTATKLRLAYGGTNADLSAAPVGSSLTVSSTGATGALSHIKNNLTATAAPAVTDDSASGYTYLSQWLNTTAGTLYVLTDPTVGAAVWILSTNLSAIAVALNKFRITSSDTTPGYAGTKLIPSTLIVAATGSPAGDETLQIKTAAYTASGTDTYTATPSPAITAYASGQIFAIKFTNANTGASTINLNSLGAQAIRKNGTTALASGDIAAGQLHLLAYDGTNFQIIGPVYNLPTQPTLQLTDGGVKTSGFTAAVNNKYHAAFGAAGTITFPAAATIGDFIEISYGGNYVYTHAPNGLKINTSTSNYPLLGNQTYIWSYNSVADGWV